MIVPITALAVACGICKLMQNDLEMRICLGWQVEKELGFPSGLSFAEYNEYHTKVGRPQIWFVAGLAGLFTAGILQFLAERLT